MVDFSKFAADPDRPDHIKRTVRPLSETELAEPYPVAAFPPVLRDAIVEVHEYVQAPEALIAASALSAVSAAVQTCFSVQRDALLSGPATLYLLTVAESGERKSTVDKMFTAAIREWEAEQRRKYAKAMKSYRTELEAWDVEARAIQNKIENGIFREQLDTEFDPRLLHEGRKPTEPRLKRMLRSDDTPEALARALQAYPVAAVIVAEAGVIFGSHGMNPESVTRNLAQANVMWDGGVIHQERMSRDTVHVEDMRVTMGLQVQPAVLDSFVQKTGGLAKGIGYLARFLISHPQTKQGSRYYTEPPADMPALRAFQQRMNDLLALEASFDDLGRLLHSFVRLDPDAYEVWFRFHDEVEEQMGDGQPFEDIRDVASKAADNAVRLACCLHVFSANASLQITKQAMVCASSVMRWYLNEALRFARARGATPEVRYAQLLEEWLVREVKRRAREGKDVLISVNEVRQLGPNALRGGGRFDAAIELLHDLGRLVVFKRTGKKGYDVILAAEVQREYD